MVARAEEYIIFDVVGNSLGCWCADTDYEALTEFNQQRLPEETRGSIAELATDLRHRRDDLEGST